MLYDVLGPNPDRVSTKRLKAIARQHGIKGYGCTFRRNIPLMIADKATRDFLQEIGLKSMKNEAEAAQ
jgi:hypothetical protein